jgi:hypothetical protein
LDWNVKCQAGGMYKLDIESSTFVHSSSNSLYVGTQMMIDLIPCSLCFFCSCQKSYKQ